MRAKDGTFSLSDIAGKKYGFLTAIKFNHRKNNKTYWDYKCICGKITTKDMFNVSRNATISCGCKTKEITAQKKREKIEKEYLGKVFGYLTVIEVFSEIRNNKTVRRGKCECICGKTVIRELSGLKKGLKKNRKSSCGCMPTKLKENIEIKKMMIQQKLLKYQEGAEKRGYSFELSYDNFSKLLFSNCYHCGRPPLQIFKYSKHEMQYNGIDRLENTEGYTLKNSVSCCKRCNRGKNNDTQEEWKEYEKDHAKQVIKRGFFTKKELLEMAVNL